MYSCECQKNTKTKSNTQKDYYTLNYKEKEKDSLIITPSENSNVQLNDKFKLYSNIPIVNINNDLISLRNKDSISIPFETKIDKNNLDVVFDFEMLPNDEYSISLLPNALNDFLGSANDSLSYKFSTRSRSDYGTLKLRIQNEKSYPR